MRARIEDAPPPAGVTQSEWYEVEKQIALGVWQRELDVRPHSSFRGQVRRWTDGGEASVYATQYASMAHPMRAVKQVLQTTILAPSDVVR